jgi:hypothetical protein
MSSDGLSGANDARGRIEHGKVQRADPRSVVVPAPSLPRGSTPCRAAERVHHRGSLIGLEDLAQTVEAEIADDAARVEIGAADRDTAVRQDDELAREELGLCARPPAALLRSRAPCAAAIDRCGYSCSGSAIGDRAVNGASRSPPKPCGTMGFSPRNDPQCLP